MTKPVALTVMVTASPPGGEGPGGGGGLLLWLPAVLIHPCPPLPHKQIGAKISDTCIEEISLWPLEPLFTTAPT